MRLASFTQHGALDICLSCCINSLFPSYCEVVFLCIYVPQFVYPFTSWRTFGFSSLGQLWIRAAIHICVQVCVWRTLASPCGLNLHFANGYWPQTSFSCAYLPSMYPFWWCSSLVPIFNWTYLVSLLLCLETSWSILDSSPLLAV